MAKLTLTVGLPASGKSTWAREEREHIFACGLEPPVLVSKDETRLMLHDALSPLYKWNSTDEELTRLVHQATIETALEQGRSVIVHDTNLSPKVLRSLAEVAAKHMATFEIVEFLYVPADLCVKRDARRTGYAQVGEEVIRRMVRDNLENGKFETLEKLIGELNGVTC